MTANRQRSNAFLSIVIPTYNRATQLEKCLDLQIQAAREHCIPIYVIDNASDDETSSIVESKQKDYAFLKYKRNTHNLGPDGNFEIALKLPDTEYIWLMGDTYHIPKKNIEHLLISSKITNKKCDCVVFNVGNRVLDLSNQSYTDPNELLSDLGWHMTCMSALVYNKSLIKHANFDRYRNTSFIQCGIIFEYIENRPFNIMWIPNFSVENIFEGEGRKSSWHDQTLHTWIEKWPNFIFSLPPSYSIRSKLKCISDHAKKTKMFSIKNLIILRAENILTYAGYVKFRDLSWFATGRSAYRMLLALALPPAIAKLAICSYKAARKYKKTS